MAGTRRWQKGALLGSAPFALWAQLFVLAMLALPPQALARCELDRADASVAVSYIYDGDTVQLTDGRKVRFIGINTPEIDHDGGASEPFSHAARKRLQQLIGDSSIRLRYGKERTDRYGRLLAHPYLADGRSINVLLLQEGLATSLAVPPNTGNHACYHAAEHQAREQRLGIWAHSRYRPVSPADLPRGKPGYRLVEGVIEQVVESRNSIWLELAGPMALRIARKDLVNFTDWTLLELVGRRVIVRGWPRLSKGKWRMSLRHPAAMEILTGE